MAREKRVNERYSPVDITNPNMGDSALAGDWNRELLHPTIINGIPLTQIAKNYNNFAEVADVEKFFSEVILDKVVFSTPTDKQLAIDYLKKTFHQGGFLQPASTPLSWVMQERMTIQEWAFGKQTSEEKVVPYAFASNPTKKLNIKTTSTGIEIEEIATADTLMIGHDYREAHPELFTDENGEGIYKFTPDAGNDYVLQTDCALKLDFTNFSETNPPVVEVDHNVIKFGNKFIEDKMEPDLLFTEFKIGLNQLKQSENSADKNFYQQGVQLINQLDEAFETRDPQTLLDARKALESSLIALTENLPISFQEELNKLATSDNAADKNLYQQGEQLQKLIQAGIETREPKTLLEMRRVMEASLNALTTRHDKVKFKENIAKLATLSQEVSGHGSPFWKHLGIGLLVFAGLALVAVGILAAIPTGGASLLAAVLSAVGMNATVGAGTGIAGIGAMGAGFFKHGNSTGLAKAVSKFKDGLAEARPSKEQNGEERATYRHDSDSDLGSSIADEESSPPSP